MLAIVIFTGLFTFLGKPSTTARVDQIEAGSAAAAAGFEVGDVVTVIDGSKIESFSDMQRIVGDVYKRQAWMASAAVLWFGERHERSSVA